MNNAIVKDILLIIGIVFICFLSVWLFTRPAILPIFDLSNFGTIGDAIGGITAPAIGGLGAYLVFKSFKAQQNANKIQFEALSQQREYDMLFAIYSEFKLDCKKIDQSMTGLTDYNHTKIPTLTFFYREINGASEYSKITNQLIRDLRGLTFHVWSFYDPIENILNQKKYGEKIEDTSLYILISKFLNSYDTYIKEIFSEISKADPSLLDGKVLKKDVDTAINQVESLSNHVTITYSPLL
ncbi:hypothetical protein [Ekhidna sp.]|uniref:hypothetical protein n=1 Tax=Ekhidna sp. TaxID=2608089 RepID=UPI0035181181